MRVIPVTLSLGILDRHCLPASYSIAFLSSHWRPRDGDEWLVSSSLEVVVREPLGACSSASICREFQLCQCSLAGWSAGDVRISSDYERNLQSFHPV